jgi:putative DNA primase/helicase
MGAMDDARDGTLAAEEEFQRREDQRERRRRRAIANVDAEDAARSGPPLVAYRANQLATADFPPREPVLYRGEQVFLYAGQIAEVFARRGDGKTWLLLTLALLIAYGKSAMGFDVRKPRRVLYVDGEMQRDDIVARVLLLAERLGIDLAPDDPSDMLGPKSNLTIIAADWQPDPMPRVDTPAGQLALQPYVDEADVVMFDNRSCLFDPEGEKDPTAWQPAGDYLLSLRRKGKTMLLAHHANRQGGARGIGKPEDHMDLVIALARPDGVPNEGAIFRLSIQPEDGGKMRGIWGPVAIPFTVRLTPKGWVMVDGRPSAHEAIETRLREYFATVMALNDENQLPKTMSAAIGKVTGDKSDKMAVFKDLVAGGVIVQVDGRYRLAEVNS